jgi:hypothetical protein
MLIVGLLAVLLWCFGFGGLFAWAVYVAPKHFGEKNFRMRWKFLFRKFTPAQRWFSSVIILKGILLNIGFIVMSDPQLQLLWVAGCLAIFCTMLGVFKPWRIVQLNTADISAQLSLLFVATILMYYMPQVDGLTGTMNTMILLVSFLILLVAVLSVTYLMASQTLPASINLKKKQTSLIREAMEKCTLVDGEWLVQTLNLLPDAEFLGLVEGCTALSRTISFAAPGISQDGFGRKKKIHMEIVI